MVSNNSNRRAKRYQTSTNDTEPRKTKGNAHLPTNLYHNSRTHTLLSRVMYPVSSNCAKFREIPLPRQSLELQNEVDISAPYKTKWVVHVI